MAKNQKNLENQDTYESYTLTSIFNNHSDLQLFEFLLVHKYLDYSISDLSDYTKLSRPTIHKILKDFKMLDLVDKLENGKYTYGSSDFANQLAGYFMGVSIAYHRYVNKKNLNHS